MSIVLNPLSLLPWLGWGNESGDVLSFQKMHFLIYFRIIKLIKWLASSLHIVVGRGTENISSSLALTTKSFCLFVFFMYLFWNTAVSLLSGLWEAEEEVTGISDVLRHVVLSSRGRYLHPVFSLMHFLCIFCVSFGWFFSATGFHSFATEKQERLDNVCFLHMREHRL